MAATAPAADASANVVPDTNFQACLNSYLGQDATAPITADQLATIVGTTSPVSGYLQCVDRGITSIEGAQYLTNPNLHQIELSNNQISDVTPLIGLTNVTKLSLYDNQITDASPLAAMTWLAELALGHNHISDISMLSVNNCPIAPDSSVSVPGGNPQDWTCGSADYGAQSLTATATSGSPELLPSGIKSLTATPTINWTVWESDLATINSDGTVTYSQPGIYHLGFAAEKPAGYPDDVAFPETQNGPGGAWDANGEDEQNFAYFGTLCNDYDSCPSDNNNVYGGGFPLMGRIMGMVTVTVTAPTSTTPTPSIPDSTVALQAGDASTTGGAARLADGTDSSTITTTIVDTDGHPVTGLASQLTATSDPTGATFSSFTDNGDGTYTLHVTSDTPGNYQVSVALNGQAIGEPIPVNFIAADITQPTVQTGATESATGLGFQPDEQVSVTVHSTPLALGTFTAKPDGTVPVTFTVPADFETGTHTVQFTGAQSGTVNVDFQVVAAETTPAPTPTPTGTPTPTAQPGQNAPAGGAPVSGGAPAGAALALLVAGLGAVLIVRTRKIGLGHEA